LIYQQSGIFSNFSRISEFCFQKLNFNKNPSILVFFFFKKKDYLILEAKKKKKQTFGLIGKRINLIVVNFLFFVNSDHFYVNYFFSKFLFKLIFLGKNDI